MTSGSIPALPYPEHPDDRVELNVVDMASLEREGGEAKVSRDAAEAEFVARRVRALLDSGFSVTDGNAFRMVQPEDIAILLPLSRLGHGAPDPGIGPSPHSLEQRRLRRFFRGD